MDQAGMPPQPAPVEPPAEQDPSTGPSDAMPQEAADVFAIAAAQEATSKRPEVQFREPEEAGEWLEMLDRLEKQYEEGEKALAAEDWETALAALEKIAEADPEFRDVQEILARAREENELSQWYEQASAQGEAGHWAEACRLWLQVVRRRPDYRDGDALSGLVDATKRLLDEYEPLEGKLQESAADP